MIIRLEVKRRLTLGVIAFLSAGVLVLAGIVIRDARRMAWFDYTEANISIIAVYVEDYKKQHGRYPDSLGDLLKEPDVSTNDVLIPLVTARAGTRFGYRPSSNGFLITAFQDGGWLSKSMKVEKEYRTGEAPK